MKRLLVLLLLGGLTAGFYLALHTSFAGVAPLGPLLDPARGLYYTARQTGPPASASVAIAPLDEPVTVVRDQRGVPHIFAASDRDAVIALGYVVAQDRLFQLDFVSRVASGRLASAMGPAAVSADRFLRRTGMDWGARRNLRRIRREDGIERDLATWYADGVNAYLSELSREDLPLEFRLLGYAPDAYSPLDVLRVLQYMTYDLTYGTDLPVYAELQDTLSQAQYRKLYPRYSDLYVPIVPDRESGPVTRTRAAPRGEVGLSSLARQYLHRRRRLRNTPAEGFIPGKGSNNWAVDSTRSTTGAPILAGDMHLGLSLPSVWYEAHLVTPSMNTYGVTVPGSPLPVEAFNDHVGWTFTNTGADQIDHYALELDSTGTEYQYQEGFRSLERVVDTIHVKGGQPVIDTLYFSHWGPLVEKQGDGAMAVQWVGHKMSTTLRALWGMNRAATYKEFEQALSHWDTPMQNILYAGRGGTIAIRSTGLLPIRRAGHGVGLLDGGNDTFEWTGRVPFERLPHARSPSQGHLSSTNQQPIDSSYAFYLGHDWRDAYRSLRIDSLLRQKKRHSVADLKRYQSDVYVQQADLFLPLIDTLRGLSPGANSVRSLLANWNRKAAVDRPEPLAFKLFMDRLTEMTWDELIFQATVPPTSMRLYRLLTEEPRSQWLDVVDTAEEEDAAGLLRGALEAAVDSLHRRYGADVEAWAWGDHHQVVFQHLTGAEALRPLWRGPFPFPGFVETLSPAGSMRTTHSASWRVVVDFSGREPTGYGIYPGGQRGNPFSPLYDVHLPAYLDFRYFRLRRPDSAEDMEERSSSLRLLPSS